GSIWIRISQRRPVTLTLSCRAVALARDLAVDMHPKTDLQKVAIRLGNSSLLRAVASLSGKLDKDCFPSSFNRPVHSNIKWLENWGAVGGQF
ncbi:hypothetical protein RRG08_049487, partial [Elysia crispata]